MPSQCPYDNCVLYKDVFELLINKSANVNALDKYGRSALDAAFNTTETQGKFCI